jgi:hypothetical protein
MDEIIKAKVKPFGKSAHILFQRKFTGRVVTVTIPEKQKLFWLLSNEEKKQFVQYVKQKAENHEKKEKILECLQEIEENDEFSLDALKFLLKYSDKSELIEKIKKAYKID